MPFVLRPSVSPAPGAPAADVEQGGRRDVAAVVAPLAAPLKGGDSHLHHHEEEHHHHQAPTTPPSSIANPAPLGLLAFGVTTCLLMFRTAKWVETEHLGLVVAFAFFLGGAGQVVAGFCDLLRGDAFGGTAFSLYGAFWLGWGLLNVLSIQAGPQVFAPPAAFKVGETLFLSLFALLTALLFVPTMRKSAGLMYVFASLATTFALLAGGVWSAACNVAAGYVGLLCGAGAIALAFATLYKETLGLESFLTRPVRLL